MLVTMLLLRKTLFQVNYLYKLLYEIITLSFYRITMAFWQNISTGSILYMITYKLLFATIINGCFVNKVTEILYFLHSEAHRNQQVRVVRQEHRQLTQFTERHVPNKIPDGNRKKCVVCSSSHERFRKTMNTVVVP